MQNKANLWQTKMNLTFCYKRDYENKSAFGVRKNKAKSKPISNAETAYPACRMRDCRGPGDLVMTSLNRFLRSLRSVGMTKGVLGMTKVALGITNWVMLKCLSIGLLVLVVLGAAGCGAGGLFGSREPPVGEFEDVAHIDNAVGGGEVCSAARAAGGGAVIKGEDRKVIKIDVVIVIEVARLRHALVEMHLSVAGAYQDVQVAVAGPVADKRPGARRAREVDSDAIGFNRLITGEVRLGVGSGISVEQELAFGIAREDVFFAVAVQVEDVGTRTAKGYEQVGAVGPGEGLCAEVRRRIGSLVDEEMYFAVEHPDDEVFPAVAIPVHGRGCGPISYVDVGL